MILTGIDAYFYFVQNFRIGGQDDMWTIIIAFILRLIAEGIDPSEAVNRASSKYGVSASDIWYRM